MTSPYDDIQQADDLMEIVFVDHEAVVNIEDADDIGYSGLVCLGSITVSNVTVEKSARIVILEEVKDTTSGQNSHQQCEKTIQNDSTNTIASRDNETVNNIQLAWSDHENKRPMPKSYPPRVPCKSHTDSDTCIKTESRSAEISIPHKRRSLRKGIPVKPLQVLVKKEKLLKMERYMKRCVTAPQNSRKETPNKALVKKEKVIKMERHTRRCVTTPQNSKKATLQNKKTLLKNQCHLCFKVQRTPSELFRHLRRHTGEKPFRCLRCPKTFYDGNTLSLHLRNKHKLFETMYYCSRCYQGFNSSRKLKVHNKTKHSSFEASLREQLEEKGLSSTESVTEPTNSGSMLAALGNGKTGKKKNNEKTQVTMSNTTLGRVVKRCPLCYKKYSSKGHMTRHLSICKASKAEIVNRKQSRENSCPKMSSTKGDKANSKSCPSVCSVTKSAFNSDRRVAVGHHHALRIKTEPLRTSISSDNSIPCDSNSESGSDLRGFRTRYALQGHLRSHNNATDTSSSEQDVVVSTVHGDSYQTHSQPPQLRKRVETRGSSKENMSSTIRHRILEKAGKKLLVCSSCKMSFSGVYALEKHKRTNCKARQSRGNKSQPKSKRMSRLGLLSADQNDNSCPICYKKYSSKGNMMRHLNTCKASKAEIVNRKQSRENSCHKMSSTKGDKANSKSCPSVCSVTKICL